MYILYLNILLVHGEDTDEKDALSNETWTNII